MERAVNGGDCGSEGLFVACGNGDCQRAIKNDVFFIMCVFIIANCFLCPSGCFRPDTNKRSSILISNTSKEVFCIFAADEVRRDY